MSEMLSAEGRLQADIDKLKDPSASKEKFETKEIQELSQALDILGRLREDTFKDVSGVGYNKLRKASEYLDRLLRSQFGRVNSLAFRR